MARTHGIVKTSIWDVENDFRQLPKDAQRLYLLLISQPQISNCGIVPYTPERWQRMAADETKRAINGALRALSDTNYCIVDARTGELLVRTFIRHDRIASQPNLVKAAQREYQAIESDHIRALLLAMHPDMFSREAISSGRVVKPLTEGVAEGVKKEVPEPLTEGVAEPPRARAGASPTPSPTPKSKSEEQQQTQTALQPAASEQNPTTSAAAAEEPGPSEQQISATIDRIPGADLGTYAQVHALAQQLSASLYDDVVERTQARIGNGNVRNPAGLLIELLKLAAREARARAALSGVPTLADEVVLDAQSYARGNHPWPVAEDLLGRKLERAGIAGDDRLELLDQAADAYHATVAETSVGG